MYTIFIVVGNLGKDPEMRFTPSGQAVTSFSVASTRKYTAGSGEQVSETTWIRVSTWGKLAETCKQYLKKGSKVLVEGRLTPDKATGSPRVWTKSDGSTGASFDMSASTVRFLDGANAGQAHAAEADAPAEDEVPF